MTQWFILIAWLVWGVLFAYWFVNHFLDNQRWQDTGTKPGGFAILMMVMVGPLMTVIIAWCGVWDSLTSENKPNVIQRIFGIKEL